MRQTARTFCSKQSMSCKQYFLYDYLTWLTCMKSPGCGFKLLSFTKLLMVPWETGEGDLSALLPSPPVHPDSSVKNVKQQPSLVHKDQVPPLSHSREKRSQLPPSLSVPIQTLRGGGKQVFPVYKPCFWKLSRGDVTANTLKTHLSDAQTHTRSRSESYL